MERLVPGSRCAFTAVSLYERVSLLGAPPLSCSGANPSSAVSFVDSYLVDPASSHMLVSKIKPCMSKFTLLSNGETANGSLNQSRFLR